MARSADPQLFSKYSQERKRFHNNKAKWAHGARPLYGQQQLRNDGHNRPLPAKYRPDRRHVHLAADFVKKRHNFARDIGLSDAVDDAIDTRHDSDPSGLSLTQLRRDLDFEVPENNPNVYYSYDARQSPSHGEDTLSVALNRALERFDAKETDRIVREYEFVAESEGSVSDGPEYHSEPDEDYEFVDLNQ